MSIEVRNVSKRFGASGHSRTCRSRSSEALTALLAVRLGQIHAARIVARLEQPEGEIRLAGADATFRAGARRQFVFQHYAAFKHMTVRGNIAFGLKVRKRPKARSAPAWTSCSARAARRLRRSPSRSPADSAGGSARCCSPDPQVLSSTSRSDSGRSRSRRLRLAAPLRRGAHDDGLRHPRPGRGDGRRDTASSSLNKGRVEQVAPP